MLEVKFQIWVEADFGASVFLRGRRRTERGVHKEISPLPTDACRSPCSFWVLRGICAPPERRPNPVRSFLRGDMHPGKNKVITGFRQEEKAEADEAIVYMLACPVRVLLSKLD